jgi:hypothetical protein
MLCVIKVYEIQTYNYKNFVAKVKEKKMAKKKFIIGISMLVLTFGIVLAGCGDLIKESVKCSKDGKCDSTGPLNKIECDTSSCAANEGRGECNCLK